MGESKIGDTSDSKASCDLDQILDSIDESTEREKRDARRNNNRKTRETRQAAWKKDPVKFILDNTLEGGGGVLLNPRTNRPLRVNRICQIGNIHIPEQLINFVRHHKRMPKPGYHLHHTVGGPGQRKNNHWSNIEEVPKDVHLRMPRANALPKGMYKLLACVEKDAGRYSMKARTSRAGGKWVSGKDFCIGSFNSKAELDSVMSALPDKFFTLKEIKEMKQKYSKRVTKIPEGLYAIYVSSRKNRSGVKLYHILCVPSRSGYMDEQLSPQSIQSIAWITREQTQNVLTKTLAKLGLIDKKFFTVVDLRNIRDTIYEGNQ